MNDEQVALELTKMYIQQTELILSKEEIIDIYKYILSNLKIV